MSTIIAVMGTRPEAVKMAPVIAALAAYDSLTVIPVATAQHRQMLDEVLRVFEIVPAHDLNVMTDDQEIADVTAKCVVGIDRVLKRERPAMVLGQGDTTTVLAAALAAYYNRVPFGHVEAGLRTADKFSPFPEEMNRRAVAVLADLHFAPTGGARENLLREGIAEESIHVCGNPVVDAVQHIAAQPLPAGHLGAQIDEFRGRIEKLVLVTAHRRESFGAPMEEICRALLEIAEADPEVGILLPVHPNPNVRGVVERVLSHHPRICLTGPLDYPGFVHLLRDARVALTDSGGVQEEAPSLGTPVLVLREKTERPEGISVGVARLVGTDRRRIVAETRALLAGGEAHRRMVSAVNPYGDGRAAARIAALVAAFVEGDR
ncbi:MAG: UDP-N-acetylglucosamine 2-epimerase (non-hydrolyzing) [Candidatus Eisenbacteria sp.]|nr:UDP-N-acetylglucosamine 2-epimerase (non-hydrolyzing) [Candidatus Eisenbacteria bacterium]